MKFYTMTAAIALGMAAAASPALAQDETSQTAGGFDRDSHFDGLYISGFAGLGVQNNDGGDSIVFDANRDGTFGDTVNTAAGANAFSPGFCNGTARGSAPGATCAGDKDGLEYGGRVGWDNRMGNVVVGGLVEFNKSKSRDGTSAFSTTPASYSITRKLDYAVSARARAGFTPGGGALFYATGGASYAKINHRFSTTNTVNAFDEQSDGKRVWGWQAGGGGEVMLTDHMSLGLEYLFNRYKDNKYSVAVTQGTAPATNPFLLQSAGTNLRTSDRNFEVHSLRGTVSFQF